MRVLIDNTSNAKQYIEKDKLVLVENDEMIKLDVFGDETMNNSNALFQVMCNLLGFGRVEKKIYFVLLYSKEKIKNLATLNRISSELFGGSKRECEPYVQSMINRGIIGTDYENNYVVRESYDLNNYKNCNHLIIKLN